MASQWPNWICKNSCPESKKKWPGGIPKDKGYGMRRCPFCKSPLVRYRQYEEIK